MSRARQLVVVGAGGFGREVIDVVDAINAASSSCPVWEVLGVVDDSPSDINLERLERRGTPFLGSVDQNLNESSSAHYVVGIGSPRVRQIVADRYDAAGWSAATLIHPAATTGFDVGIGEGSVICAGVRLTTNIKLGRHVHLNLNVTVGHDSNIGSFVTVNPLASISGDCVIEDKVLVGAGAVVLNGLTVGTESTVGGSACVVKDVPRRMVVKGVPAR